MTMKLLRVVSILIVLSLAACSKGKSSGDEATSAAPAPPPAATTAATTAAATPPPAPAKQAAPKPTSTTETCRANFTRTCTHECDSRVAAKTVGQPTKRKIEMDICLAECAKAAVRDCP